MSSSVFRDVCHRSYGNRNQMCNEVAKSTKNSLGFVQRLGLLQKLPVHTGCVNTVSWNDTGELLLSGSDDQHLCITSSDTHKVLVSMQTRHRANIFSARFLPNSDDRRVVSCSGNGLVVYTEVERSQDSARGNCFSCHTGTAYKVVTIPNDGNTFLSCGEDGTVRCFDLRIKTQCTVEDCTEDTLIDCSHPITSIAVDPVAHYSLAVGSSDSYVRIYDRRMLGTMEADGNARTRGHCGLVNKFSVQEVEGRSHRITSLVYSASGKDILVSYSSENLYLLHLEGQESCSSTLPERALDDTYEKSVASSSTRPMKKLRLRGDWSDTGPKARPEREWRDSGQQPSVRASLMRHVSDVLTRMINDPGRNPSAGNLGVSSSILPSSERESSLDNLSGSSLEREFDVAGTSSVFPNTISPSNATNVSEDSNMDLEQSIEENLTELNAPYISNSVVLEGVCNLREENLNSSQLVDINESVETATLHNKGYSPHGLEIECGTRSSDVATESFAHLQERLEENDSELASSTNRDKINRDRHPIVQSMEDEILEKYDRRELEYKSVLNLPQPSVLQKYVGHRNSRTMIKEANFWGDNFVMSGSDCGHVFIWEKYTAELIMIIEADGHVVNCLQPHPFDPILATSGIDYDVKLWAPLSEQTDFDLGYAMEIIGRNRVMEEETRDTITVPASFMIRMLASFNHLRHGGMLARWRQRARRNNPNS